jgi:Protein of unknown function (DUF2637)
VTDRLIRITTALAVLAVAGVAAIISYQHAYELVTSHGETGITAHLLPFTVDGLIWAASMVVLDASRRNHRVPRLAALSLAVGIVATIGANLAHGLNHGPIGALVSAWPALALVGSFELLMLLIRKGDPAGAQHPSISETSRDSRILALQEPLLERSGIDRRAQATVAAPVVELPDGTIFNRAPKDMRSWELHATYRLAWHLAYFRPNASLARALANWLCVAQGELERRGEYRPESLPPQSM